MKDAAKLIAQNKKAYHDYFIEETFQAGLVLVGTEVKSLRQNKCNIKESYVRIDNNEAFIINMNISPYEKGNIFNKDPLRIRKLLLHKKEINKLIGASAQDGYTLMPLRIYFHKSLVKIDIGIAKGKKLHDKRHSIATKDMQREAAREFKQRIR